MKHCVAERKTRRISVYRVVTWSRRTSAPLRKRCLYRPAMPVTVGRSCVAAAWLVLTKAHYAHRNVESVHGRREEMQEGRKEKDHFFVISQKVHRGTFTELSDSIFRRNSVCL